MSLSRSASPRSDSPVITVMGAVIGVFIMCTTGWTIAHSTNDLPVTQFFNSLRGSPLGTLVDAVYWAFQPPRAVAFVAILMVVLYVLRSSVALSLTFGLTIALTWLPIVGFKEYFQRPRPDRALLEYPVETVPADWGFPSGHTAFVTAVAVALVLVVASSSSVSRTAKEVKKLMLAKVLAAVAIVLIAMCVLVEGVHYPSDALASMVWSVTVTPAVWLALNALLIRKNAVLLGSAQHSDGQEK